MKEKPKLASSDEKNNERLNSRVSVFFINFTKILKFSLSLLPVFLGLYDEISDFIYYFTSEFIDSHIKTIFLVFLFLSPLVQFLCWMYLLWVVNMKDKEK